MLMSELPTPKIDRLRKALDFAVLSEQTQIELPYDGTRNGHVPVEIEGNGTIQMAWNQGNWFQTFTKEYAQRLSWLSDDVEALAVAPAEDSDWYQFSGDTAEHYNSERNDKTMPEGVCGTAGCLAGWGVVAYAKTEGLKVQVSGFGEFTSDYVVKSDDPAHPGTSISSAAQIYVFGLTDQEAETLFAAGNDTDDIKEYIDKIEAGYFRRGKVTYRGMYVEDAPAWPAGEPYPGNDDEDDEVEDEDFYGDQDEEDDDN